MNYNTLSTSFKSKEEFSIEKFSIEAFRSGDHKVFKSVYDHLCDKLFYFTISKYNIKSDISEDIVAEGFFRLYKYRKNLESYDHIKRWLFVIIKNLCIDHIREMRDVRKQFNEILSTTSEIAEDPTALEIIKNGVLYKMWEEINRLPKQRRQVLLLYFFEHKNTHQIAEILDLSPQTVLNHKSRAIKQMKFKIFEDEDNVKNLSIISSFNYK